MHNVFFNLSNVCICFIRKNGQFPNCQSSFITEHGQLLSNGLGYDCVVASDLVNTKESVLPVCD